MEKIKALQAKKIAFIGGGAMAEAIIKGILAGGLLAASDIYVGNRTQKRCDYLNEKYGINAMTDNKAAVAEADFRFSRRPLRGRRRCKARPSRSRGFRLPFRS